MARKKEPWRRLRIGDRVRIVQLPTFEGVPGGGLQSETRDVYERLIARGRPARVFQIDEYGSPWIYCRFRRPDGSWEMHWLAINDDSWVLVVPRDRQGAMSRLGRKSNKSQTPKRKPGTNPKPH